MAQHTQKNTFFIYLLVWMMMYLTYAKESCNADGKTIWCYYYDINPSATTAISQQVNITDGKENAKTWFYVYFTPKNLPCLSPAVTLTFQLIDYDTTAEFVDIRKVYKGNFYRIKSGYCQGGQHTQCTTWDTCLDNYLLPEPVVDVDEPYKIEITQG
eukprot:312075_1